MNAELVGLVMDTAEKINAMCDAAKVEHGCRVRMHAVHGAMLAHGAQTQEDILHTIGNALESERVSDQEFFEGKQA